MTTTTASIAATDLARSAWMRMWSAGIEAGAERLFTGTTFGEYCAADYAAMLDWQIVQHDTHSFDSVLAIAPG